MRPGFSPPAEPCRLFAAGCWQKPIVVPRLPPDESGARRSRAPGRSDTKRAEDPGGRLKRGAQDVLPALRVDRSAGGYLGNSLRTAFDTLTLDWAAHGAEGLQTIPCVHIQLLILGFELTAAAGSQRQPE